MSSDRNVARLLGVAFLFVFVASLISTQLLSTAIGSGDIPQILAAVAASLSLMRAGILVGLLTSAGIVVLAILLYIVLHKQNKIIALVALGWWMAEAIVLAVSKLGALALIPLSLEYVGAGTPEPSQYQALGRFLYSGLYGQGDDIHMLFYCLGGVLWFYLFYRSRCIPRVLSALGLAIESLGLIGMVLLLSAVQVSMLVFYPIAALELAVGLWLLVRGVPDASETRRHLA